MNLDFTHNAGFSWYVVLLLISGVIMLAMAAMPRSGQGAGWRIINLLVSLGFLGYGVYLAFFFTGGTYFIFFKVFFVPVLLLVNFVRTLARRRSAAPAMPSSGPMPPSGPMQQYPPAGSQQYPPAPAPQYPPAPAPYPSAGSQQYPPAGMPPYSGQAQAPAPGIPPQA